MVSGTTFSILFLYLLPLRKSSLFITGQKEIVRLHISIH